MLFNVEYDVGDRIVGYLVPDNFSGQATVSVTRGGEELLRLDTDEPRDALVSAGRHETGLCGFTLDETKLPGLSGMEDLEIREAETGLIIFRRFRPEAVVHRKIFRLETHMLPLWRLDKAFEHLFQFHFPSIERFGLETCNQMFLMNNSDSVYASGRLSFRSLEHYLEQGYSTVVLLRDPYEELAERLLVLRLMAQGRGNYLGQRDMLALEAATAFAAEMPTDDDRKLRRWFREMPRSVVGVFGDPLVQQLTTRGGDSQITKASVSAALDVLASCELVGLRAESGLFEESLAAFCGVDPVALPPIPDLPAATLLADRLRPMPEVEELLEHDIMLFRHVRTAFKKAANAQ